jgi:hypothetical protein
MPLSQWRFRPAGFDRTVDVPVVPRFSVTTMEATVQATIEGVSVIPALRYQFTDAINAGCLQFILHGLAPELAPITLYTPHRAPCP